MVSSTTPFVFLSTTHTNTITHKGAPNKDSSSNRAVTPAGSIVSSRIAPISSLCLSLSARIPFPQNQAVTTPCVDP